MDTYCDLVVGLYRGDELVRSVVLEDPRRRWCEIWNDLGEELEARPLTTLQGNLPSEE
jgi:hypothetical protein